MIKSDLDTFILYNTYRTQIVDFIECKIKRVPRKQTIIDINYGLFSASKQLNLFDFKSPKIIASNIWLRESELHKRIYLHDLTFYKNKKNLEIISLNSWYNSNLGVEDIKSKIRKELDIKSEKCVDVIANTLKYTYNAFDFSNESSGYKITISNQKDIYVNLSNIVVGDIIIIPLATKRNKRIHDLAKKIMKLGASVIILEPLGKSQLDLDVDAEDKIIYSEAFIPFRVVYYSMF